MMYISQPKNTFTVAFKRQLNSIFEAPSKYETNRYNDNKIRIFSFLLPNSARFPYTSYIFLYNELIEAFNSFFPSGFDILYIKPNSNDDHYIDVAIFLHIT